MPKIVSRCMDALVRGMSEKEQTDDWDVISKLMPHPEKIKPEMIRTYTMNVEHNLVDRYATRMSKAALETFIYSIVGKGKLNGHDKTIHGDGRIYKAWTEQVTKDQAIEFYGATSDKKLSQTLDLIQERDGGFYFGKASFYVLNVTSEDQDLARKYDAGINIFVSASFLSPKRVVVSKEDGKFVETKYDWYGENDGLWVEFKNTDDQVTEGIEVSSVGAGAVNGAMVKSGYTGRRHRKQNYKAGERKMKITIPELEIKDFELQDGTIADFSQKVVVKFDEIQKQFTENKALLTQEQEKLKALEPLKVDLASAKQALISYRTEVEKAIGTQDATIMAGLKSEAEAYKNELVHRLIQYQVDLQLLDIANKEVLESKTKEFNAFTVDRLNTTNAEMATLLSKMKPAAGQLTEAKSELQEAKPKKLEIGNMYRIG